MRSRAIQFCHNRGRWYFCVWGSGVSLFALKLCSNIPEILKWLVLSNKKKNYVLVPSEGFKSKYTFQHILSFHLKRWQAILYIIIYGHCFIRLRPRVRMTQRLQLTWDENIVWVKTEPYWMKTLKFWGYLLLQQNLPCLDRIYAMTFISERGLQLCFVYFSTFRIKNTLPFGLPWQKVIKSVIPWSSDWDCVSTAGGHRFDSWSRN